MNYREFLIDKVVDNTGNDVVDIDFLNNFQNIGNIEKLTDEEKHLVFKEELNEIKNYNVKNIAIEVLENLPHEFWYKPNFSEYGNTNKREEGVGGNILHTKKSFEIAKDLIKAWGLDDYKRDIVLAATLLHDSFLDTLTTADKDSNKVLHMHLIEPRLKFIKLQYLINSVEDKDAFDLIMKGIEGHTGDSCLIPSLRYGEEDDFLKIIHIADYLANERGVVA